MENFLMNSYCLQVLQLKTDALKHMCIIIQNNIKQFDV